MAETKFFVRESDFDLGHKAKTTRFPTLTEEYSIEYPALMLKDP